MEFDVPELPLEINVFDTESLLLGSDPSGMLLLDCRRHDEYELVHIDGCKLIPMEEIHERVDELNEHRTQRVVVYCHLGGRSLRVAHWLRQQGFTQAQSMSGGVDAWAEQIDKSLPRY